MIDISKLKDPSPWHPMDSAIDIKNIGKLGEEICEAGAAIFRCIIQGVDESHPVTEKPNKEWLEDELADVMAGINLVTAHFGLDEDRMNERMNAKMLHLKKWHDMA